MLLYIIFVDITKAFDNANNEALSNILQKLGYPGHFASLVSVLYTGIMASFFRGELSEPLEVGNGGRQGFVLFPHIVLDFSFYGLVWCLHLFPKGI